MILIQKEYEIIGMFAPCSEQLPRHNCANAPTLDDSKVLAFKNLMQNPHLPTELKITIAERFEDFICHIELTITPAQRLQHLLERIYPSIEEYKKLGWEHLEI